MAKQIRKEYKFLLFLLILAVLLTWLMPPEEASALTTTVPAKEGGIPLGRMALVFFGAMIGIVILKHFVDARAKKQKIQECMEHWENNLLVFGDRIEDAKDSLLRQMNEMDVDCISIEQCGTGFLSEYKRIVVEQVMFLPHKYDIEVYRKFAMQYHLGNFAFNTLPTASELIQAAEQNTQNDIAVIAHNADIFNKELEQSQASIHNQAIMTELYQEMDKKINSTHKYEAIEAAACLHELIRTLEFKQEVLKFCKQNYTQADIDFNMNEFWKELLKTPEFETYQYVPNYETKWMYSYFAQHIGRRQKARLNTLHDMQKERRHIAGMDI